MSLYMVLTPPPTGDAARDADRVAFVKEGFCWPALFFAVPWLIYRGLWLVLAGYLAVSIAVALAGEAIGGMAPLLAGLALSLVFALEANGLRRWTLERRGWTFAGVVAGRGREACEARFFRAWRPETVRPQTVRPDATRTTSPARTVPASPWPGPRRPGGDEVVGLFPEAGR